MNPEFFPLPPPVEPLPLDLWLRRPDRAESGREAFFRGRAAEFEVFRSAILLLSEGIVGGGTMVFQGAPGAGKSALMAECLEAVRCHSTPEDPWVAVSLPPEILQSPVDVLEAILDATQAETERLRALVPRTAVARRLDDLQAHGQRLSRELWDRGGGAFGLSVGRRREETVTAARAFRQAAPVLGGFRIVVCVDEAQNVPVEPSTKGVLDCLHRDPRGIPLVTAFFGLSDTEAMLGEGGLSRLAHERIVNLEPLPIDTAATAVESLFDAYGFTGAPADHDAWVQALADRSQGWPQHLNRVSVAAARQLQARGGRLDAASLEAALAAADAAKQEYYAARVAAGRGRATVYGALARAVHDAGGMLPVEALAPYIGEQTLDAFLTNALHAGLLAPVRHPPDYYRIPIPSLGDYLRTLPPAPSL